MPDITMSHVESSAKRYADAHAQLVERVQALHAAIEAVKREHLRGIKSAVASTAERHDVLRTIVEGAPQLFRKPRSVVLHGVRVGYAKAKGSIKVPDEERTLTLIRKHFPDQVETLIRTYEEPVKAALANLAVDDLMRIGCKVTGTGDVVLIKPVDSEVDKLVAALLKDATESFSEQAEEATA